MAEMAAGTVIKAEDIAIFIKDTSDYFRLTYTTNLDITCDTETDEKKFIGLKSKTVFEKSKSFALSNDLYTIKGEKDFEYFFNKWYESLTKTLLPIETLIVYKSHGDESAGFKAWHFPKTNIAFADYNGVDSTINYDLNFGDGELGTVTMASGKPTFKPAG